jgi:hypothetical protein
LAPAIATGATIGFAAENVADTLALLSDPLVTTSVTV